MPPITANNHCIWSTHALYVRDGETGASYNAFTAARVIVSWADGTRDGFFKAHALAVGPAGPVHYDFSLVAISGCDDDTLEGLFDIYRGGALVLRGGVGKLYGLGQPPGPNNYFKLYVGTSLAYAESWHIGALINQRLDFV